MFDTNKFKSFVAERFRTPPGAPGCLQLFAATQAEHQMFADHSAAEYPKSREQVTAGYEVDEWVQRMNRDDHWWDCVVGATVAASVQGLRWAEGAAAGAPPAPKKSKRVIDIEELYKAANPNEVFP